MRGPPSKRAEGERGSPRIPEGYCYYTATTPITATTTTATTITTNRSSSSSSCSSSSTSTGTSSGGSRSSSSSSDRWPRSGASSPALSTSASPTSPSLAHLTRGAGILMQHIQFFVFHSPNSACTWCSYFVFIELVLETKICRRQPRHLGCLRVPKPKRSFAKCNKTDQT